MIDSVSFDVGIILYIARGAFDIRYNLDFIEYYNLGRGRGLYDE